MRSFARPLLLALALSGCAAEVPPAAELTLVEGTYARATVKEEAMATSVLTLELQGNPRRFTAWLPPRWDKEEDVPAACSGGPVSLRVDRSGEIWEMSCRGTQLFTYEYKASLARQTWGMGVQSVVTVIAVVLLVVLLVWRTRKHPSAGE